MMDEQEMANTGQRAGHPRPDLRLTDPMEHEGQHQKDQVKPEIPSKRDARQSGIKLTAVPHGLDRQDTTQCDRHQDALAVKPRHR